jgi:phosphinothricin acetyltransferase
MTLLTARTAPVRRPVADLDLTIEPADEAHLGGMATVYREQAMGGLGTWEDPLPDAVEMGRRLAAVRAAGLPAYVALDAQRRVIGFSWARPFRNRAAYRETVEDSIYVAARARRRGVGRALLAAVIEASARQGCRQMIAVIGDARNLPSIRLHKSLGFSAAGYLRGAGWKPDGRVDVVLLQRDLDGEPSRRRVATRARCWDNQACCSITT